MCDLWRDTECLSSHSCTAEGGKLGVTLGRHPLIPRLGLRYRLNFVVVFFFFCILVRYTHHKIHQFYLFFLFIFDILFVYSLSPFSFLRILSMFWSYTPLSRSPVSNVWFCSILRACRLEWDYQPCLSSAFCVPQMKLCTLLKISSPFPSSQPLKISLPSASMNLTFACRPSCRLDHLMTDNSYGHRRVPLHFSMYEPF